MRAAATAILVALSMVAGAWGAQAHSLGVDKADLTEMADGRYSLVSRVPARLAPAITMPQLPDRCAIEGNPRGTRGNYEVRFTFSCKTPLTAEDEIRLPWKRDGVMLTVQWQGAEPTTRFARREGAVITIGLAEYLAGSGSLWNGIKRYTVLGVEHILAGIDHLLFVLGLLMLVSGPWMLVKTITAFTVAHSLTLALATLGFVNMPSAPVEAAIALSIVFLAVEIVNGYRGRLSLTHRKPWLVAFGFGLLHGLGFAGALSEIGLPPQEVPLALLFFNIGVELGQLMFVGLALAGLRFWDRLAVPTPRWAVLVPAYALGVISTYWFFERSGTIFLPA